MVQINQKAVEIQKSTGLKTIHFADLVRAAQIICDPCSGVSGRKLVVNWQSFGISVEIEENLKLLGKKYQYASPHVSIEIVWEQLTPETRNWFMENKNDICKIEEAFPALDED